MFTIRQMRYFEALATIRHFGAAADKVGVSQPALSVQIAEMEKAIGLPLFERMPKGVILTTTGRDFLPIIRSILKQVKTLDEMSSLYRGPFHGILRIGIIPTLAPYILPSLLPVIKQNYPNLSLELHEAKTTTLASELAIGNLDLTLAAEPFPIDAVKSKHLFSDPFYLGTSKQEQRYDKGVDNVDDIDITQLLLLEEGHCLRDQALDICSANNYLQEYGATSLTTLLQLVANDFGVTLIPQIACIDDSNLKNLKILNFKHSHPKRDISLFWRERSPRDKEYEQFAEILINVVKPLQKKANQNIQLQE
ncbi:hydrogen peroxide-inducible genes activator [Bartonella sp. HY038]|uniref:hydrogen peroxide-inducible genes activator n=1 Tax=Bartonella sp. HY038 TaxID=2759660 RepID=UPI0015F807A6|nr:hydrogen peroxide-inducible genes activator [Bartonella sp. HY038]